jgi:hypothetical protein
MVRGESFDKLKQAFLRLKHRRDAVNVNANRTKVHTIVLHFFPDLEALFMLWIILRFPIVREHFGVVPGAFEFKTIPSGPLRPEDWVGVLPAGTPPTAAALARLGYLFVDCGGGGAPLDQHGRKENVESNRVASIDLLVKLVALLRGLPNFLQAMVLLVSRHDLTGESVAKFSRKERKESATPATPRDLHMMLLGWNLLHPVEEVIRLAMIAFDGVMVQLLQADQTIDDVSDEFMIDVKGMNLFALDQIIAGLSLHAQEHPEVDVPKFRKEAERALLRAERERSCAARDFRNTAKTWDFNATIVRRDTPGKLEPVRLKMTVGVSDSHRFGEYCRFHKRRKEDCGGTEDHGADVVIQFSASEKGKFVVSTRGGIDLTTVAAALRAAEMLCRGAVPVDPIGSIDAPGQFRMQKDGEMLWPIYFPEFRTAVGNNFRTNPSLPPSVLTHREIVGIVRQTLQGLPPGVSPDQDRDLPCDWKQPRCPTWCQYRAANLHGCEKWRSRNWSVSAQ